jgi:hypothetical protein
MNLRKPFAILKGFCTTHSEKEKEKKSKVRVPHHLAFEYCCYSHAQTRS